MNSVGRLQRLERLLREEIEGEVRFSEGDRALYATDASNYRQLPLGVVMPASVRDVEITLAHCRELGLPLLARGGGTSLAGQCCNEAVVLDFSKYLHRVLEIRAGERWARVEPGVVLDDLRNEAEKHGLTFGPDPATHDRCTLGGMLGNNSCGVHSVMAGRTSDNVLELEVLTYDGTRLRVGATSPGALDELCRQEGRTGEIYRGLRSIRDRYGEEVRHRFPRIPRRVSGYNLDELLPENGFHVARSLVGTEGTCVLILEAKLRLVPSPPRRGLLVAGFRDILEAAAACPPLMETGPIGLEAVDDVMIANMRLKHLLQEDLALLPRGRSFLLVEMGATTEEDCAAALGRARARVQGLAGFEAARVFLDPGEVKRVWKVRESGLGATASVPAQPDTWEGWEDSAVPPQRLSDYLRDLQGLYRKYHYQGALYGHFGQGCVHTRITFDLASGSGIRRYHDFTVEAAQLVASYGGSLSGEHGDGQSRAELLPIQFGGEVVKGFREFKELWDPQNRMNPGKVVDAFGNTENLRLGADYEPWEPRTFFRFPEDHNSFSRAALRCVGVGLCRKREAGVMCPSFMATREEKHSTRGRARLLFEMLRGSPLRERWRSQAVREALDLCLSCKGCKGECPVGVDMATYKAEFLHHYYRGRLRSRAAYSMGFISRWARMASLVPGLANGLAQSRLGGRLAKWLAGIHPGRGIPRFADETFRQWARSASRSSFPESRGREPVILWVDTFSNHFHPQVARSAWNVLEQLGFSPALPRSPLCCGRPLYDFGFLPTALRWLERILGELRHEIREGTSFLFLEPSCASVFRDELLNLLPHDQDAIRLAQQSFLLSEFLERRRPDFAWPRLPGTFLLQGHCHHRSVLGFPAELRLLGKVCSDLRVLDSGCCGMAGSFGFERRHYEISREIGALKLFPALREAPEEARVLANGFSCREQIFQETGREVIHLAQLLEEALALAAVRERRVA